MKKLLGKSLIFIFIFCAVFLFLDEKFYDGESGWNATDNWKGQNFDIVFLGNSHVFCNINPVIIDEALNLNTINLTSPSQPSEITYWNFKRLLSMNRPKAIVIELNILRVTVNDLYEQEKQGLIYNALDGMRNPIYRARTILSIIPEDRMLEAFSQLLRTTNTWSRYKNWDRKFQPFGIKGFNPKSKIDDKIVDLSVVENKYNDSNGKRPGNRVIKLEWFGKILDLAQQNDIPVYLIKTPLNFYSDIYADIMYDVEKLSKEYPVVKDIHNFNENLTEMDLNSKDFYDTNHLNRIGSNKFTEYLAKYIGEQIDISPDFKRVGWYKSEDYRQLSDNEWRYTIGLFDGTSIKFSVTDAKGNILEETDFSDNNYFDIPRVGNNRKLTYTIKGIDKHSYTYDHEQTFTFMSDPGFLIEFTENSLNVQQEYNTVSVTNNFQKVPGTYAWRIIKDGTAILYQPYDNTNTFTYTFTEPGTYYIDALFMMSQDNNEKKLVKTAEFAVDKNGILSFSK